MIYREDTSISARREEIAIKLERVRELLRREGKKGLVLMRQTNFSWITAGGKDQVTIYLEAGVATILITEKAQYAITNIIEQARMRDEEKLEELGFEIISQPWYEDKTAQIVADLIGGDLQQVLSDMPLGNAQVRNDLIKPLRYSLTDNEIGRYMYLGETLSRNLEEYIVTLKPGMSEYEITGGLCEALWKDNIEQMLFLVGTDERARLYRHAIPTAKKLDKQVVISVNGKYKGLITTVTRIVHFGKNEQLDRYYHDAVNVDVDTLSTLQIGCDDLQAYHANRRAYCERGYEDMWAAHSQGGAQGYDNRDYTITESNHGITQKNQCYCFNPVIHGAKTEDAVILTDKGFIEVTRPVSFPAIECEINGTVIRKPGIQFID